MGNGITTVNLYHSIKTVSEEGGRDAVSPEDTVLSLLKTFDNVLKITINITQSSEKYFGVIFIFNTRFSVNKNE